MSSEEDDPVVEEIDVFLSRQLTDCLLLLQYPVRPGHITYDNAQHISTKIKPKQLKLEMEVAINTSSPNYAKSKGEQIALNVDGSDSKDKFYSSDKMDKQILSSMPVGVDTNRYVLGTFRDKELHLTPLKGVLQLRPSFGYLDCADSKIKDHPGAEGVDEIQEEEEDAKPVMVKFARQETDEGKARRVASYDYMRKQQEEESWSQVNYHQMDDLMAENERCLLYSRQSSDTSEFYLSQEEYLQRLMPKAETTEEEKPAMPNNVLSMVDLKKMSLGDQVKALLMSAKVIRFSQLMSLLPKGSDATAVLRIVQQVALLVQGCWVVKSEVLYPKDSSSAHSGVPAETLGRGRDYIMWRFTQNRYLVRKDISSVIKLPAEDVKDVLEQMARLKVNKGWEFLMDFDSEFVNRHVEVLQRQQMLWERKFQQLAQCLNITKADLKLAASAAAAANASPKRRRTISRSRTKSGGEHSMSDFSDIDMDPSKEDRQRHSSGAERRQSVSGSSRQRQLSFTDTPENGIDTNRTSIPPDSKLVHESSEKAKHDSLALKKELVKFAADRLHSRLVLSLSDYKRLFLRKIAECPPGHILGAGVSDKMLEHSLSEVGGKRLSSIDPNVDSVFIMDKVGDEGDPVRSVIVEMLDEKPQLRIDHVRKRLLKSGLDVPPDNEIKKFLKDYCVAKNTVWHLKCTLQQETS